MDQYRAAAYLDLLNGITAVTRIATGYLVTATRADSADTDTAGTSDIRGTGEPGTAGPDMAGSVTPDCQCRECDGRCVSTQDDDDPADGSPEGSGSEPDGPPRPADLVVPLATLLGLAERPGEGYGLGPLDPALCRELAAAAIGSRWTQLCVTVTDADGIAIGHGCARPARKRKQRSTSQRAPGTGAALVLPARVNLTITAARLAELAASGPPGGSPPSRPPGLRPWSLTPTGDPGPPGGYGTWHLTLPDGRQLTVNLEPVPRWHATTGTNRTPTSPTTPSVTWSRSATTSAPSRPARATRENPTSNTPFPTTRAAVLAVARPALAVALATR